MIYHNIISASRIFLFFGALVFSSLHTVAYAADLHLILIGDTASKDLESSIYLDLEAMERHASEISRYTGLKVRTQHITGRTAVAAEILAAVNRLETADDDVIFFYFSGHGYRTPSKGDNPWPNLYFATNQTGVDLLEVAEVLNNKKARFKLVLADCCNNSLPDHLAPPVLKKQIEAKAVDRKIRQNFERLFIDKKGLVLIASSKAGQSSWSINKFGSLYTGAYNEVFNSFVKHLRSDLVDWQTVLDQVSYKSHQIATKHNIAQDPINAIQLTN